MDLQNWHSQVACLLNLVNLDCIYIILNEYPQNLSWYLILKNSLILVSVWIQDITFQKLTLLNLVQYHVDFDIWDWPIFEAF